RCEKPHAHIRRIETAERLEDERFIFGANRPHEERHTLLSGYVPFELLWIGADREAQGRRRAGAQANPGIERNNARLIRDQWVYVQLGDIRQIGDKLRELDERERNPVEIGGVAPTVNLEQAEQPRAVHMRTRQPR